jgi:electron transfer flavoprotein alpha subunit
MSSGSNVKENTEGQGRVWILAEHSDGKLARVSLELLGKGRELAGALDSEVWAILLGCGVKGLAEELIYGGAEKVLLADDTILADYDTSVYSQVVTEEALRHKPDILLIGAMDIGRDLAPRIAARIGTGLTADCVALDIQQETGLLLQTKHGYSGNMMFTFVCPEHRPQMATIRPGLLQASSRDASRRGEIIPVSVSPSEEHTRVRILKEAKRARQGSSLEEARVVVACGRGIGGLENFHRLEEMAESLGAAIAVTKEVVDAGWISDGHMVGQTGKTVKPELYIACGLSGAIQHTSGMWDSGIIVAINKDPKAEIFRIADYGIEGDLAEIIPALIEEIGRANP